MHSIKIERSRHPIPFERCLHEDSSPLQIAPNDVGLAEGTATTSALQWNSAVVCATELSSQTCHARAIRDTLMAIPQQLSLLQLQP